MKAEKMKSGNWRARVSYVDPLTKKRYFKSFTASTKKEAEYMALEFDARGHIALLSKDSTIKEIIRTFIDTRSSVCSPTTLRGYESLYKQAYSTIERLKVSELTQTIIQAWVNQFASTHSPKTTRNAYGLLRSALTTFDPQMKISAKLPQKAVPVRNIPTEEQVKLLIDKASPNLRKAILLASIGTLRRGEICALAYEDINGDTIHVHASMVEGVNGYILKPTPKTSNSDRFIQVPHKLIEELGEGEGRIITVMPNAITQAFDDLRDKCDLKCRFHDLRHYAASMMHAIGIPDVYIMERGGWASDTVLKSIYRNSLDDQQQKFTNITNEKMADLL